MSKPRRVRPPHSPHIARQDGVPPRAPARIPLNDAARDAAFRAIARQARIAPNFDIEAMTRRTGEGDGPASATLSELDAAFAHAIYHNVMRRWLTLSHLLGREVTQGFSKLEPRVQAALLAGAAQLLFMDRVPAHAAIHHAVEWAKQMVRPGAGGLVNAVLRKVAGQVGSGDPATADSRWRSAYSNLADELPLGDGRAVVLREPVLPTDEVERLAVATSHPPELLRRWAQARGSDIAARRALHSLLWPPTILNIAYAGDQTCERLASLEHGTTSPHEREGFVRWTGARAALVELLRGCADIWVQDPSSAGAVMSIADLAPSPRRIIDYCAGQGTKTRQLAHQFPDAEIVATDSDPGRFETLGRSLDGFRIAGRDGRVVVQPISTLRTTGELGRFGYADLILLDVPCSNTGVLARRPEARYRYSERSQEAVTGIQRQIIADCLPLLSDQPGQARHILYATCSLEPEENAAQAAWVRRWHKFAPGRERSVEPCGEADGAARYADGAYSVLLTGAGR
ncbi:MAG: hypothetical protein IT438_16400 [Phycisphaerales bacterium]|nr:hypothetical protein [Phycisphaerales bacterium]